jgi:hypothetical protein
LAGAALARCGPRAAELSRVQGPLLELARTLEPDDPATGLSPRRGATVRTQVALLLGQLRLRCLTGGMPTWLRPPVEHLVAVLRRLGPGLYRCYDVPGLPRTDNALEQFYRYLKRGQRRITGRRRTAASVVGVSGGAVYATAASGVPEAEVLRRLAAVPAAAWQQERLTLRAAHDRQAQRRRFRRDPAAYLADLEARWAALAHPP